jgi:DNA polymerase III subunit delta'
VSSQTDIREPDQLDGVPLPEERTRVFGHQEALANVALSFANERAPSAILIHGPQGIGKATLAFEIARQVLVRTGDEDPHRVAEQIAAGAHPNVFVLRRQPKDAKGFYTVIRVDDVRELRERMRKTRGRAGFRVAVIDSIDDCNPSAANALLKTLEEPPAETLFLLVSHRPGSLLPTIKSRCHTMALRPIDNDTVRAVLEADGQDDADALNHAIALADGRPRRAFEALQMGDQASLMALQAWLTAPARPGAIAHLSLAEAIGSDWAGSQGSFARGMLTDWLANEAKSAAMAGPEARARLASANELWEKAHSLFAEAESLNLDARQTLIAIMDAIRRHVQKSSVSEAL